jgi:beta-glucosidase
MNYLNQSSSISERVEDLLGQMTIEEKVAQLSCILPTQLMGKEIPDADLMECYMSLGLGRITQFGSISWDSPIENTKLANTIQSWIIENTRLKIPVLFQIEASNGLLAVDATIFPSPINLANSWNPDLVHEAAEVVRQQMLAIGTRKALAPVFDLAHDPRWGRVDETYGEDPYLSAAIGCSYVSGLQTDNLQDGVAACGKHFIGYSKSQGGINKAEVSMSERDLYEYFAYPFEAAIRDFDLKSVMCTYSSINGVPASINKPILRDLLRGKLGFQGNLLCDGGSVEMVITDFHAADSLMEAAIKTLEAGLEANTPVSDAFKYLPEAVKQNKIDVRLIDDAVRSILKLKFELGLFENPFVPENAVEIAYRENKEKNRELAENLAAESLILLKNEGHLLPFTEVNKTISLIGPHIDRLLACFPGFSTPASLELYKGFFSDLSEQGKKDESKKSSMGGISNAEEKILIEKLDGEAKGFDNFYDSYEAMANYLGDISTEEFIDCHYGVKTLVDAFKQYAPAGSRFVTASGCEINSDNCSGFDEAVRAASQSDIAVLCLGDRSDWLEGTAGECHDSTTLQLPGVQHDLIKAVYATGIPIVLVIFEARPHSIVWEYENVPAILDVWYPGEMGSVAIAKTIFGLSNPSGKLSVTVPRSVGQVPIYYNHRIGSGYYDPITEKEIERTGLFHSYYNESATPLLHFGHGLSYTSFAYQKLAITPQQIKVGDKVQISCVISNTGDFDGKEVIQLYTFDREAHTARPVKSLNAFCKVALKKGESKEVKFTLDTRQLAQLNMEMELCVEPGNIDVMLGSSSNDIRLKGVFAMTGDKYCLAHRQVFRALSDIKIV